jgi:PadR family transcriptional regulator PadR
MGRGTLGSFEQLVLLAILQVGDGTYAVPIVREIEERTGRTIAHAAVYVALKRLEARGMVTSWLGEPTAEQGGRAKRFYKVEPDAVRRLNDDRVALQAMWEGLEQGS